MERIDSVKNQKIKNVKKLHTRKGREKFGSFIIEGAHLVEEAIKSGVVINEIFVEENVELNSKLESCEAPIYIVNDKVMKEISETETPQGLVAVCELLGRKPLQLRTNGKYILLDKVQDPGNLGTIIRTADSAGCDGIILGNGTVDVYNGKVLRATQGSVFHLPVVRGDLEEWIDQLKKEGISVYGTALNDQAVSYKEVEPQDGFALVMGNEGSGLDPAILSKTSANLYIPIYGKAESLNVAVATGILLYHLQKS